jgi:hypothetical protein
MEDLVKGLCEMETALKVQREKWPMATSPYP